MGLYNGWNSICGILRTVSGIVERWEPNGYGSKKDYEWSLRSFISEELPGSVATQCEPEKDRSASGMMQ